MIKDDFALACAQVHTLLDFADAVLESAHGWCTMPINDTMLDGAGKDIEELRNKLFHIKADVLQVRAANSGV